VSVAARRLGCNPRTIYRRAEKSPRIREAIDQAREELIDQAEAKLREAVQRGEVWAVSLVLKTLGKKRGYVKRQEHTIGGIADEPIHVVLRWPEKQDGNAGS